VVENGDGVVEVDERHVIGLRAPEPAGVVADHAVALGEGRDLPIPHPETAEPAVDEEEGMSFAVDLD
jgi:hypothetical protein